MLEYTDRLDLNTPSVSWPSDVGRVSRVFRRGRTAADSFPAYEITESRIGRRLSIEGKSSAYRYYSILFRRGNVLTARVAESQRGFVADLFRTVRCRSFCSNSRGFVNKRTSSKIVRLSNSRRSVKTRYVSKIFMILECRDFSADVCDLSVPFFFLFQSNTIKRILKIVDISSKLVFWPTFIWIIFKIITW